MAVLPILATPDPRLRLISAPVAAVDARVRQLAADMLETMHAAPGIGLAAIQVGEPLRLIVMDLTDGPPAETAPDTPDAEEPKGTPNPRVLVNAEVLEESEEGAVYNEGCLSVPEMYADVERAARVRARWHDLDGNLHDGWIDGLLATCVQHEIDHTDGVMFFDHLSKLKRDMLLKRYSKQRRDAA